jgi:hypothetical protein
MGDFEIKYLMHRLAMSEVVIFTVVRMAVVVSPCESLGWTKRPFTVPMDNLYPLVRRQIWALFDVMACEAINDRKVVYREMSVLLWDEPYSLMPRVIWCFALTLAHAAVSAWVIALRTFSRVENRGSLPSRSWKTNKGSPTNSLPNLVGVRLLLAMNASTVDLKVSISFIASYNRKQPIIQEVFSYWTKNIKNGTYSAWIR